LHLSRYMRLAFLVLVGLVASAPLSGQQPATGRLKVILRDESGAPFEHGYVALYGSQVSGTTDRNGVVNLADLPSGAQRFLIRALGFNGMDTAIVVRAGRTVTLSLTMRVPEYQKRARAQAAIADSMRQANGGIDSIAAELVTPDTAGQFSFERFGIDLLAAAIATTSPDTSRVLSPLSAGQAFGLVLLAARDSTARALIGGLRLGELSALELASRSRRFMDQAARRRDLILKVANGLWVDTSVTLNADFKRVARDSFAAAARELALSDASIVPLLNAWADTNTSGRIRKIRDTAYDTTTKVVITNAVYLKSTWLVPFEVDATKPWPFTTARGDRIDVPSMERTTGLAYRRGDGYQAVRLPYAAGLTAMYVVLPDSGLPVVSVLDALKRDGWPLPHPRQAQTVHLRLPRVHVEQRTSLIPVLEALGMGIVHDSLRADFQGLVVPRPYQPPLCPPVHEPQPEPCARYFVRDATQDVYFDLDEQGTEAAAVTSVEIAELIVTASPPPIQFLVDRPFFFAIRDELTGVMLFVGYIADPRR